MGNGGPIITSSSTCRRSRLKSARLLGFPQMQAASQTSLHWSNAVPRSEPVPDEPG